MFQVRKKSQSFRFPYKKIKTEIGNISYPIVPIVIVGSDGLYKHEFVVDTGADISTLPQYIAHELNIDLDKLESGNSQGVGEDLVKTWEGKINIKIRKVEMEIRCSFVSSNKIPPLLGKLDIFDNFNLYFDNDHNRLVLTQR